MATSNGWDVEQQLKRRGVAVHRHRGRDGDELQVDCPLCNDRRGRLYYNPVKRWAWCHHECGRISQRQFFEAFGLVDFDAASRSEVAELLERHVVGEVHGTRQGPAGVPFPISSAVLAWWHPVSRAYLESRRVTRTQSLRYFLTYVPACLRHRRDYDLTCVSCYCRERIVVPIQRVGFMARDVTRKAFLKDKTLPGSKVRTTLYGLERFKGRTAVLVQGGVGRLRPRRPPAGARHLRRGAVRDAAAALAAPRRRRSGAALGRRPAGARGGRAGGEADSNAGAGARGGTAGRQGPGRAAAGAGAGSR